MPLIPFAAALESAGVAHKCILLGNGFSIAYSADMFAYTSLYNRAIIAGGQQRLQQVFEEFETKDFEFVMKALCSSSRISQLYNCRKECSLHMIEDIENLRSALINVIINSHPEHRHVITANQYNNTGSFLRNFKSFYTTNYDFLIYWCLFGGNNPLQDMIRDGFFPNEYGDLAWNAGNEQNLYYLHGALHLYHHQTIIKKISYARNGMLLRDQVKENIDSNILPMIVSEGTSGQKLERIEGNKYLSHSLSKLGTDHGALFIHGHSMSDNDSHIWDSISRNNGFTEFYVSLYGKEDSAENIRIQAKARNVAGARPVTFYSSESVPLWLDNA